MAKKMQRQCVRMYYLLYSIDYILYITDILYITIDYILHIKNFIRVYYLLMQKFT